MKIRILNLLSVLFLSLPLSISAQNDAIERFFGQYMDDENFTVVYVTPKMFQMIAKLDLKDDKNREARELKEALSGIKGLRILTTETNPLQYYKEAVAKFKTNEYELLMTVRDKDENVRFWTKEQNGVVNELLMLVGGKSEFVMISFLGQLDLNKLTKLSDKINITGTEHLKELKNK